MMKNIKFGIFLLYVGTYLISGSSLQSSQASQEAVRPQKPLRHEVSVTLKLPDVEPDEYTLRLVAEHPASGARARVASHFIIE